MKKTIQTLIVSKITLFVSIFFLVGCSETEEPTPVVEENSLYIEFTLDGTKFRSEILEENLVSGTGFERKTDNTPGLNVMIYNFFDYSMSMLYSNKCGTESGKDCLSFIIFMTESIKVGSYPSVFTNSLEINGTQYQLRYIGPEINPRPADLPLSMVITKFDETTRIVEGTMTGQFYKQNDPSLKAYSFQAKFRINIYKG
ncbi:MULTISPECIES: hypothetical protein [unclassified Algoriphagus]|uniref:hypothetical protein n=1 Tax=unclassified Algoriphagus TaxID=2641541 RepID=UPI00164F865F|nr:MULTISPECIES: hypothetical protein [unclassified Algoriphagus]MBC6366275.1 hypothetical protein [Algoriphagus sp. AK58]